MTSFDYTGILTQAVDELSDSQSYKGLFHQHKDGDPLPSAKSLYKIVELARSILFPGYFGNSTINSHTITYHIGVNVENLFDLLTDQIQAGLCFGQENNNNENTNNNEPCRETAALLAARFISKLPEMRRILATDVEAAYYGDPAATCFGEIISCYPAIRAISNYRIASGKSRALLPLSPLRTVRESFPSYGSSNSIFLFVVRNRLILSTVSFISLVAVVMDKLPYN